jgi:hypothetical protein
MLVARCCAGAAVRDGYQATAGATAEPLIHVRCVVELAPSTPEQARPGLAILPSTRPSSMSIIASWQYLASMQLGLVSFRVTHNADPVPHLPVSARPPRRPPPPPPPISPSHSASTTLPSRSSPTRIQRHSRQGMPAGLCGPVLRHRSATALARIPTVPTACCFP